MAIPEGWEERRLEEVCLEKGQYGANSPKQPYDPMLPRYVRITDIDSAGRLKKEDPVSIDWASAEGHILSDGDILLARSGATVGKSYLHRNVTIPCAFAGYLIRFRPELERLAPEFLAQYLYTPTYWKWVADTQRAQAQPNINAAEYGSLLLPLPPLPEQKKIAAILSSVDDTIAKTESVITQLQIVKKAMMEQLLTKGMPGRHTRFKQTEIGELPEEWEVVRLIEACEFLDERRIPIKSTERRAGPFPYYGASGIIDYIDEYIFDEPIVLLAEDGANILSRSTPVAFKVLGKCWVNNHAHVFRPRIGTEIDFLVEYLESLDYEPYSTGTAQPKLNQAVCQRIPMPRPSVTEQSEIGQIIRTLSHREMTEKVALSALRDLKTALSSSLLSGEIRVVPEVA